MIKTGTFSKGKISFKADSEQTAKLVRVGLAGKSPKLHTAPFGDPIHITSDYKDVMCTKAEHMPFIYEEARALIKRIQYFGKIDVAIVTKLLQTSRSLLKRDMTFCYPDAVVTDVEITFAYNWLAITFSGEMYDMLHEEIEAIIRNHIEPPIRISHNENDTVNVQNFHLDGVSLPFVCFQEIFQLLTTHGIMREEEYDWMCEKAYLTMVRAVCFMAFHMQGFSESNTMDIKTLCAHKEFLLREEAKRILTLIDQVVSKGGFRSGSNSLLKFCYHLGSDPSSLKESSNLKIINQLLYNTVVHFAERCGETLDEKGVSKD